MNVGGWTRENGELREQLIRTVNADIFSLCETHLKGSEAISLNGYVWFGHNRLLLHRNAPKGSGGVGILVKEWICTDYDVTIVDKSYDGILVLRFIHKDSDFEFVIISGYLPPENSPRGRDAQGFFSHILAQLYMLADADSIFLTGDFNSRLGSLSDIIIETDTVPTRRIIDTSINQHEHDMLEFMIEAKLCTLNGRFNSDDDNYTSISTKGKAIVDYICVPHDVLQTIKTFEVLNINSVVNSGQLHGLIGQRARLPDHSVLLTEFTVSIS